MLLSWPKLVRPHFLVSSPKKQKDDMVQTFGHFRRPLKLIFNSLAIFKWPEYLSTYLSSLCPISILPGNIRKPPIFYVFEGNRNKMLAWNGLWLYTCEFHDFFHLSKYFCTCHWSNLMPQKLKLSKWNLKMDPWTLR